MFCPARCVRAELAGLMTIGRLDESPKDDCFQRLLACRRQVAGELQVPEHALELSMGMSGDYELAVRARALLRRGPLRLNACMLHVRCLGVCVCVCLRTRECHKLVGGARY